MYVGTVGNVWSLGVRSIAYEKGRLVIALIAGVISESRDSYPLSAIGTALN